MFISFYFPHVQMYTYIHTYIHTYILSYLLTYLLVLFVPTGTKGLNFTIVEVSIEVNFFTETGLLALCSNLQPGGVHILVAFYDMHGLQWDYSFPRSPHGETYTYTD
jgi:hypothetical protein